MFKNVSIEKALKINRYGQNHVNITHFQILSFLPDRNARKKSVCQILESYVEIVDLGYTSV